MGGDGSEGKQTASLTGDWTVARAGELHDLARSLAAGGNVVELECSEVGRVDLSALQVLLALSRSLAAKGGGLKLAAPSATLTNALALTGFDAELLR